MLVQHVEPGVEADHLAGDRAEAAVGEQRDRGADVLGLENSAVNRPLREGRAPVVVENVGPTSSGSRLSSRSAPVVEK